MTKALSINLSYGLVDAKSSGDLIVTQPKQNLYVGGEYKFGPIMGGVQPTLRVDASSHTAFSTLKCPAGSAQDPGKDTCRVDASLTPAQIAALPALQQEARMPASTQLSARLTFANIKLFGDSEARFSLWGRNLLNEKKPEYVFSLGGTTVASTYQRPRSYGIDMSADF